MVYNGIDRLVGNTPVLEYGGTAAHLFLKLESFNPTGSVKDRAALFMIEDAEARGALRAGGTIVEPTSGNTGIGLAALSAVRGYRCILVMPDTMSVERRKLLAAYGAEIVLTEGKLGMRGAIDRARQIAEETGAFLPGQFENPANPAAHYATTGPELLRDLKRVDFFVAGVGTGGTLTGTGRYLKEHCPSVKIVAVEPAASPVLSEGRAGAHKIQGIGAGFVPQILDRTLIDEVIPVPDEAAMDGMRELARTKGLLVGISSGAAFAAAKEIARRDGSAGKNIAVILPDSGDRYLSLL